MKVTWILLFLILANTEDAHSETLTAYRTIHASPYDFIQALRTAPASANPNPSGSGRLARFFRVTKKVVRPPQIEMEVIPDFPLNSTWFEQFSRLNLTLTETSPHENHYTLEAQVKVRDRNPLRCTITVAPTSQGSLVGFHFPPEYKDWKLEALRDAAVKLGFVTLASETK